MRDRSIRFKMTLWFFVVLSVAVALTFFVMRYVSGSVLKRTIRDYLVGTVEANVGGVTFVTPGEKEAREDGESRYIAFNDGYLEVEPNFLFAVHDVYTALYTADGRMLYGENPLARQLDNRQFDDAKMWDMNYNGVDYSIYDRAFVEEELEGLWMRGVVSYEESAAQMNDITRLCLFLFPGMILLAMLGGYLFIGRMLKPLSEIEQAAAEISYSTDLKKRMNMKGPKDEIRYLADAFDHMVERLDNAFEAEHRFTSDVSHELRTPMAVILAQIEYTLDKDRSQEEYVDALRVIRRQGVRMNGLINDMLDYTRLEQQSDRYPFSKIDISTITRDVCDDMQRLKTNGITLKSEIFGDIYLNGNAMLYTRLLQNLISNAYRYGKEDGEIRVRLFNDKEKAVLSVEDNGIGISEEDKEHLFERFYRAESARTQKGSGLGLSMVKRIAELHGAEITVESVVMSGTAFKILFPEWKEET